MAVVSHAAEYPLKFAVILHERLRWDWVFQLVCRTERKWVRSGWQCARCTTRNEGILVGPK